MFRKKSHLRSILGLFSVYFRSLSYGMYVCKRNVGIIDAATGSRNAVLEFARYLGMNPSEDTSLLWIAQEAML